MDTRYPSVYVDRLGRQLALWHQYGLSDARAMKLLQLWIGYGLTQYMDKEGRYTFHSFNALRKILGYKTTVEMIDDVRRSQSFILLSCDVDVKLLKEYQFPCEVRPNRELQDGLTCFFSPLWKTLEEKDGNALPGSIVASRILSRICDDIDNNTLDNKIPSGGSAGAMMKEESKRQLTAAQEYFRGLIHNANPQQREPIDHLVRWLGQPEQPKPGQLKGYGLDAEQAYEVIDIMIETELAPHFAFDKSFSDPDKVKHPEKRIYQVTGFIKRYASKMVGNAVSRWRKRRASREASEAARLEAAIRKNRPLSPYEWQDLDGRRWMDDRQGRAVTIKPEAPPRPSDTAQWNYFDKCWTI